jgi:CheY-like chemotaxis protein
MPDRILLVDDEPMVLAGYERHLKRVFSVETAVGGEQGLYAIANHGPFAVVVSDLRMPGMDGIRFLATVREKAPDTVRIMLTGQADVEAAVSAVNEGNLFRFLTKPCEITLLATSIKAAVGQHQLVTAEKELLEKTLTGAVRVMTELLSAANPRAFGRALRVKKLVRAVADKLNLPGRWQIELAAMLSQIGCVTVPADLIDRDAAGQQLDADQREQLASIPKLSAQLLAHIPRLDLIRELIARMDPQGDRRGTDLVGTGSRLLVTAYLWDRLLGHGMPAAEVLQILRKEGDAVVADILYDLDHAGERRTLKALHVSDLQPGMLLDEDVLATNGILLVAKGQELTEAALMRLRTMSRIKGVREPIRVAVGAE